MRRQCPLQAYPVVTAIVGGVGEDCNFRGGLQLKEASDQWPV